MSNDVLWAPWRVGYILRGNSPPEIEEGVELLPGADRDCFLCACAATANDEGHLVVGRDVYSVTVLNRYPYNNGHLLIAPRRHRGRLDQLSPEEHAALMSVMTHMVGVLEESLRPDGFNIGLNLGKPAGAGLPGHLHWHVVPRWSGDTNFMPITAGARVIPQSLEASWQMLREALKS